MSKEIVILRRTEKFKAPLFPNIATSFKLMDPLTMSASVFGIALLPSCTPNKDLTERCCHQSTHTQVYSISSDS